MTEHDPHPTAPDHGKPPLHAAHGAHDQPAAGRAHPEGRLAQLVHTLKRAGIWMLAALCVVLAVWKFFGDRAREADAAEREARLRSAARGFVIEEAKSMLTLAGSFIGRQVTPAMRSGDFGAVRAMFRHAKEFDHVEDLSLIRNDGKVLVATNSPLEGTSASAMFRDLTSKLDVILVDENLKGKIRVIVPVRNHEITLGVVVLAWDATHIDTALTP